jgi:hypothetical protein
MFRKTMAVITGQEPDSEIALGLAARARRPPRPSNAATQLVA